MALALPPPMDYALEGDGFFSRVFDMEMIKPAAAALGGGALGGVAYKYLSGISFFDSDLKEGLLALGLGFAGARALWGEPMDNSQEIQMRRNMAKGHMGVMAYVIAEKIIRLMENDEERTRAAEINRKVIEERNNVYIEMKKMEEAYLDVVARHGAN